MLLKPAVPDVEPETAVSPPRINGVRRPPKQAQPNASLSVMQQQMTDCDPVYPGTSGEDGRKTQSNHNAATNIKAAPLRSHFCYAWCRSGILKAVLAELQHRLRQISEFQREPGGGGGN